MPLMQTKDAPTFRKAAETFQARAKALPQRYFVSPEIFAQEQSEIFSRNWLLVGHKGQLKKSGDFFVIEVPAPPSQGYGATKESLIVVRDQKSEIRAFYNVCRHRGTRLKEDTCGHTSAIQCPYHAWTYGLDGRLIGAPHMDDVPGFDKADYPLHRVNLGLWEGFIFVNLAGASTPRSGYMPLEKWFAPLAGKFARWNLAELRSAKRIEYDGRANWKLILENYSECYHCPGVHPELSKVSPYDSAENDLSEGPFLGGFMRIAKGRSLTMSGNACALGIADKEEEGEEVKHRVFYYSIFPNMLLSLHPDYVMVHQLQPESPERTLILCDWFFHPEAFNRSDINPDDAVEFCDKVNRQDWHGCELSQHGISDRAYQPGSYKLRESHQSAEYEYYHRL